MEPRTTSNEKTGGRARLWLGLAAVSLLLLGLESFRAFTELNKTRDDVAQVGRTYVSTVEMLVSLAECVSATRAYAVTGDAALKEQHRNLRQRTVADMRDLEAEIPAMPAREAEYQRLLRLVNDRLAVLDGVVLARDEHGTQAAFARIGTPEIQQLDRHIAALAKELQRQEVTALDARLAGAAALGRRTIALLLIAVIGGLALVSAVFLVLRRALKIRSEAAARTAGEARRFRELFENSPDAMILVGRDQRIEQANTRASEVFGVPVAEFADAPLNRLMPERFRERHHAHMTAYFQNPRSRPMGAGLELIGLRGDSSEFPVEIMLSPMQTSGGLQVLAVIRDVTERAAAEKQIRALNEDLRRRADELEMANRELEAFSYSVSHDLRSPLRHIQGFADILKDHMEDRLDEKGRRYLSTIADAARRMSVLIDDLLLFSKMARTEIARQKVNLGLLVLEVQRALQQETAGRTIDWVVHPLPEVWGDLAMLRQVVFNLLANAVKYTRQRSDARIEVGTLAQDSSQEVICFVKDNGAGFDMEYAHKLFGVFQRLHSASEFEGTGVGLALVRRIVQRLGGRTWAEGAVGQGATFYFSLPEPPTLKA